MTTSDVTDVPPDSRTGELAEGLHRLAAESRARLASVRALREQHRLIAEHSRRRLEASRLLLDRGRAAGRDAALPGRRGAPGQQG